LEISYGGLLLFKMSLLQTWYGLSDYEVEDCITDSISFSKFCGLTLEQSAPDHSTLSRFRRILTKANAYEKLLKELNRRLTKHKIIVKNGAIVDASVIDTSLKPKGKNSYEIAQDREPEARKEEELAKEKEENRILKRVKRIKH
jgi:IS5 family transposase